MRTIGMYAKAVAAVIGSAVTTVEASYPSAAWLKIVLVACTALAVLAIPNTPPRSRH